jgi:hypothetical protein
MRQYNVKITPIDTHLPGQTSMDFPSETAEQLRDRGIKQAADNADAINTDWQQQALDFLKSYIKTHQTFMVEDVRYASNGIIPEPPHSRAWGAVILTAARENIVERAGYAKTSNPKAHKTPATLWKVK